MTRTVLAIATAVVVGLSASAASAAQSCPLCQYWPEVFGGNVKAAQEAEKARRAGPRSHVRAPKRGTEAKKIDTAKVDTAKVETGTIAQSDSGAAFAAHSAEDGVAAQRDEPQRDVGCMNFFPSVGKSFRVPCE